MKAKDIAIIAGVSVLDVAVVAVVTVASGGLGTPEVIAEEAAIDGALIGSMGAAEESAAAGGIALSAAEAEEGGLITGQALLPSVDASANLPAIIADLGPEGEMVAEDAEYWHVVFNLGAGGLL